MTVDVSSLSEAKRNVLLRYLRGELPIRSAERAIQPRPSSALAPLSVAQEQLWQDSLKAPTPLYNESITVHRTGPLEVGILERSIAEVIRRHEIWRTSYKVSGGTPWQVVHPAPSIFPLRTVDLRAASEGQRHALALHWASEDARRPFDLSAGPLLRGLLIRMGNEDYRIALTAHLSIVDGVSVYQVFPRELVSIYTAYSAGQSSPLPELAIQYGDYAYWQREWLTDAELYKQLAHWRVRLAGELPTLDWPRVSRPPVQTLRGAMHACTFPLETVAAMEEFCRSEATTLFTVLQAAFTTLLYRYTKQKEIIIGTFSPAGRKRSEVHPLLGHFLNSVPLRIDLSGDPSFSELLRRTRLVTSDAISHDDVPLQLLARELLPTIDERRNPFFTVGVSLQPRTSGIEPGWYVTSMDAESGGAPWDLYLAFIERPAELAGRIQYNPDLFSEGMITGLVRDLAALLAVAPRNPEQRVSRLTSQR